MNNQVPKKLKIFRGNQKPHINKVLRNAIMNLSRLKNKANKNKLVDDLIKYNKQRNLVAKLNKNCKKKTVFDDIQIKNNPKPFWDKCKPHLSNKHSKGDSHILLTEKDELSLKNKKVADVFNSYFQSITDSLDSFEWPSGSSDQIYDSVDSFCFHPSLKNIKRNNKITRKFSFKPVTEEFVKDIVNELSLNKAADAEIQLKILKECDFF